MTRPTRIAPLIAVALLGLSVTAMSVADDPQRPGEARSGRGIFGLDLDVGNGGVDIQVGPIRLQVGDDVPAERERMSWLFRRQEIVGTPVHGEAGKEIGHIEELVVDVRDGDIRYAAVEYPQAFGKDKLYAVPWRALTLYRSQAGIHFHTDVPMEKLRSAPGFDRDEWPNVGNRRWADAIDVYYGIVVKPGDLKSDFGSKVKPLDRDPHLMRSSELLELPVVNLEGKRLGKVDDFVVDFPTRKIRYGVLRLDGIGMKDEYYPVRFSALDFQPGTDGRDGKLTLRIQHALLGKSPFFSKNAWPDIRDPRWSDGVDRYYGVDQPIPEPRETE